MQQFNRTIAFYSFGPLRKLWTEHIFFPQMSHKSWIYCEFSLESISGKNTKCKFLRIITWVIVLRCTKCTAHSWEGVISRKFIQRKNMSCYLKCKVHKEIASVLLYGQKPHLDYVLPFFLTSPCMWLPQENVFEKMPDHSWIAQNFQRGG